MLPLLPELRASPSSPTSALSIPQRHHELPHAAARDLFPVAEHHHLIEPSLPSTRAVSAINLKLMAAPPPKYRNVRLRPWGKWVAEIRNPDADAKVWLDMFATGEEAARAYGAVVFRFFGSQAKVNLLPTPPQRLPTCLSLGSPLGQRRRSTVHSRQSSRPSRQCRFHDHARGGPTDPRREPRVLLVHGERARDRLFQREREEMFEELE